MGTEYVRVHLWWTLPPALILTLLYGPLCTRTDAYKIVFLICVAVVATIPWDRHLILTNVWTYPPDVIIGLKIFSIPIEEVFFFVIQTYNTSLLFLLCNQAILTPCYLLPKHSSILSRQDIEKRSNRSLASTATDDSKSNELQLQKLSVTKVLGQWILGILFGYGVIWARGGKTTYIGLILSWACLFAFFLWSIAHQFLIRLPWTSTILPITLPTVYLWILDTVALRRGTWSIEAGTKLGWNLFGLEIEEAVFFLVTNVMIVFGMVAFENGLAILETHPSLFPDLGSFPSPALLVRALLLSPTEYDKARVEGLKESVNRLSKKSRTFYLASSMFSGRLRADLILLYSFCRVADDRVDNPEESPKIRREWVKSTSCTFQHIYENRGKISSNDLQNFCPEEKTAFQFLPTTIISKRPLDEMLEGFLTDLTFEDEECTEQLDSKTRKAKKTSTRFPIKTEKDLDLYGSRVAGTVAQLCIELVYYHCQAEKINVSIEEVIANGINMGIALQYVNIARDIFADARIGRVYLPADWLANEGLKPEEFIVRCNSLIASSAEPSDTHLETLGKIEALQTKLLDRAFMLYENSKSAMDYLPREARAPMKVAIEVYMEIGRTLRQRRGKFRQGDYKEGKATVSKMRRLWVAYRTLATG